MYTKIDLFSAVIHSGVPKSGFIVDTSQAVCCRGFGEWQRQADVYPMASCAIYVNLANRVGAIFGNSLRITSSDSSMRLIALQGAAYFPSIWYGRHAVEIEDEEILLCSQSPIHPKQFLLA